MGAYPGHSGKPMQSIGRQSAIRLADGQVKITVIDPVMAGGAVTPLAKDSKWVPIKPATDGALGMAMIQWIIENEKYSEEYLASPNLQAARKVGFNSWCNAAHLVIDDANHPNYRKMLRAKDLKLDITEDKEEDFIVMDKASQEAKLHSESDAGDILFSGELEGIKVKTSFVILKESAYKFTIDEYAKDCGIPKDTIIEIAEDLTSHGTKVGVDGLGGTATANGTDLSLIHYVLTCLIGCTNKKGGMITRRVSYAGFGAGPRYALNQVEGRPESKGLIISRTGIQYETTDEYKEKLAKGENPYPPTLPWHPVGGGSDNQAIFSIINKYPYPAKIFLNWMANPLLAVPAGARQEVIESLKDPECVPLFISVDAYMGETTALADYIVPDTTPYESWGLPNIEGNFSGKGTTLRWPVVEPATMKLDDGRHASFEAYLIDVAKKLDLPGFGDEAIPNDKGQMLPLNDAADFFLRAIANVAYLENPVADISQEEIEMQDLEGRLGQWKDILTDEEWKKVMYVISRGGRFEEYGEGFDGDNRIHAFEDAVNIYVEALASGKNSLTGEYFSGVPAWNPESFIDGTLLTDEFPEEEWPFKAANYKAKFRSISMLANSPSLRQMNLNNFVEINAEDARELGIGQDDEVKVIPATGGDFIGRAMVRPGIARGTIGIAYGYGHWEYGAKGFAVDGEEKAAADGAGEGVHLMNLTDPKVKAIYGFSEASTGGPSRSGGAYRIEKV